jgi:hypothetical protein
MKATQILHNLGQSPLLDNITRKLLTQARFFTISMNCR